MEKMKPLTIGELVIEKPVIQGGMGVGTACPLWPELWQSRRSWNHFHGPDRFPGSRILRKTR